MNGKRGHKTSTGLATATRQEGEKGVRLHSTTPSAIKSCRPCRSSICGRALTRVCICGQRFYGVLTQSIQKQVTPVVCSEVGWSKRKNHSDPLFEGIRSHRCHKNRSCQILATSCQSRVVTGHPFVLICRSHLHYIVFFGIFHKFAFYVNTATDCTTN